MNVHFHRVFNQSDRSFLFKPFSSKTVHFDLVDVLRGFSKRGCFEHFLCFTLKINIVDMLERP